MSTKECGVSDYGMRVTATQIKAIAEKIIKIEEWIDEGWEDADVYEYVDRLGIESISEFSGEAQPILDNGETDWRNSLSLEGSVFYIPLNRYPTLFKAAYTSLDEAKEEIAKKIEYAIPVEIYHICGTYYG